MRYRFVTAAATSFALLLASSTVFTQAKPPAPPSGPASAADVEALRKQIQALAAGQLAIQKQLEDIRALLQQGGARPAAPAPAA
ncbi:MAG TPA: hypothetical protein VF147_12095, partial [Vicinamibacterales bacterium]